MRDAVVEPMPASAPHAAHPAAAAAIGALVGLTWAAALRAYMVTIAGPGSSFTWWTLIAILLPGAIAGACIGVAHARRARGRAWLLGFAPFAFTALTMLEPGALTALVTTGIGGGAIAVPAALVLGGFGLGTIGPRAARIPCLVLAVLLAAGFAAAVPLADGPAVAATTARGAWAILLAAGLLLTGMLGTALAFRRDRRA
ncbi:hypothetical protein ABIB37_002347 [Agrococcus sp. UYP10]|uniref:hypothetical protein n=1 Tax=Agrococcus sp. UYP10 TaxID=1756355 RepID=UPI0033942C04